MTKNQSGKKGNKGKVKVLNLNKETVKDLTEKESKGVKGGVITHTCYLPANSNGGTTDPGPRPTEGPNCSHIGGSRR
jgi:hypothetical protein